VVRAKALEHERILPWSRYGAFRGNSHRFNPCGRYSRASRIGLCGFSLVLGAAERQESSLKASSLPLLEPLLAGVLRNKWIGSSSGDFPIDTPMEPSRGFIHSSRHATPVGV
jgi:hypothetical protein